MAEMIKAGAALWHDLTVEDAGEVSSFYEKVIGWKKQPVSMGDYDDYNMNNPTDGETQAGVCHARGGNAKIPPQWMIYFAVENVDKSADMVEQNGGEIIIAPKDMGEYGRYCIIKDPAGAVCALITPPKS